MTRLILVRHGRTEWNRVERFRGRTDIELDAVGIKQAEATAERLSSLPIAAIYSSPLRRALTTASTVAKRCKLNAQVLDGVIDIDYGDWHGLSPQEAAAKDPYLFSLWLDSPHLVKFPRGESLSDVRERCALTVNELIHRHKEETFVIVSHKVVCQVMILELLGLDSAYFWRIAQDVCAINVFEIRNNTPSVLLLNDTCHLKGVTEAKEN